MAAKPRPRKTDSRPSWYKLAVRAATAYLFGHTWEEAADLVGRKPRALQYWRLTEWWPQAVAEAEAEHCRDTLLKAQRVISRALDSDDAQTARWLLERRHSAYAPPVQKGELTATVAAVRVGVPDVDLSLDEWERWQLEHLQSVERARIEAAGVPAEGDPLDSGA